MYLLLVMLMIRRKNRYFLLYPRHSWNRHQVCRRSLIDPSVYLAQLRQSLRGQTQKQQLSCLPLVVVDAVVVVAVVVVDIDVDASTREMAKRKRLKRSWLELFRLLIFHHPVPGQVSVARRRRLVLQKDHDHRVMAAAAAADHVQVPPAVSPTET